jgi:hypothetical protein
MRKFLITGVTALVVAAVAVPVALAAEKQVNVYNVTGSMKGSKGATSKSPKPVALAFAYTTKEQSGLRPSPVKAYSILFGGLKVNNSLFKGCDFNKLTDAGDTAVCPSSSIMGSGEIVNEVGQPSNLQDKSLYCYLKLTLVNSTKKNHILLFLKGVQTAPDPKKTCVTQVEEPIEAEWNKKSSGTALEFTVPDNLLHPAALDNAIVQVNSKIKNASVKKKGKKVSFFESTSCKSTQKISVTFTQESDGSKTTASTPTKCTK